MAQLVTFLVASLFCNLFALSYLQSTANGFSLKLVHIDSPYSPLYQANLSTSERLQRDNEISYSRASYFESMNKIAMKNSTLSPDAIQIPFTYRYPLFTVDISLGTPAMKKTFIFDTGSHLTWTQCFPCIRCFKQDSPLFNPMKSKSYKIMPRSHTFARWFSCSFFRCSYYVKYYSGQGSRGTVSIEKFTFAADSSRRLPQSSIGGVVFGCGILNLGPLDPLGKVSGIVGMNKVPVSLVRQLDSFTMNRFSYCIPSFDSKSKYSYVRFGGDAIIRSGNVQSTRFLRQQPNTQYRLNLIDISIAGKRLGFRRGTFWEGCIIDTGASLSLIKHVAYDVMVHEFMRYFARFKNLKRLVGQHIPRDLCYSYSRSFNNFPSLAFHFEGGNLEVPPSSLFLFERDFFCLEMMGAPNITILGIYQQQNVRFVYDIGRENLSFAKEDCSKDTS